MSIINVLCFFLPCIFAAVPSTALAGQIRLGDATIQVSTPEKFFEDGSFFEAIKQSLPNGLLAHKMYIPADGVRTLDNKRSLLDYVLITSAQSTTNKAVAQNELEELERIRDKRYAVATSVKRCYSKNENRETLQKLQSSPGKDGIFLEKYKDNGAISYLTLVPANQKERYMVSSTTFLVVNNRLLTIGAFPRIRGRAIYNSVKIVNRMTRKIISMLQANK